MPPVTPEVLLKNPEIVLEMKAPGQPISCGYEGKVGAVIHGGEYFVLSPNMDYIPEPAVNARMSFKYDSRLGDDDPLLWPQPYIAELCFFPCIPRPRSGMARTELHAVLYNTYHADYFIPISTGSLSGLGTLCPDIVAQLKVSLEACKCLHQQNEDNPNCVKTALGARHITSAETGLCHFERLPMSRKQQRFVFAQYQRAMLEFLALIQYNSTLWDRMNSSVVDRKIVDHPQDAVGAFFFDATMAHLYWKAGIPVWLVCPAFKAGTLRVDQLVDTIKGRDVLVIEDDPVDHCGVFYSGSPHSLKKYQFFNEYTRHYFSGSNPFRPATTSWSLGPPENRAVSRSPIRPNVSPTLIASTSALGPARSDNSRLPKQSKPYMKRGLKSNSAPSEMPKFLDLTGALAPPPIETWRVALLAVDVATTNRVQNFIDDNNAYAFPHPSLFINVQTDAKRMLYFMNWLKHRSALIFRISAPLTDASPIGSQLWRTLLGLELQTSQSEDPTRETKSALRKQAMRNVLASCINVADGISINLEDNNKIAWQGTELSPDEAISPEIARQILWDLAELNFRCELVGLDRRSHNDQNSADAAPPLHPNIPRPAPWNREDLLGRCFVGNSMLDIEIGHVNQGLASPIWSDRRKYLVALYNVMITWSGFRSYASSKGFLDILEVPFAENPTENETHRLEVLLTGFYAQSFFNFFGRAPVIPRRL